MKYLCIWILVITLFAIGVTPAMAVTVYFKDGTRLEVDKVTRVGNSATWSIWKI